MSDQPGTDRTAADRVMADRVMAERVEAERVEADRVDADRVELQGLAVDTVIGVYAHERRYRQRLRVDLAMPTDAAAARDDLSRTVDYDAVARAVRSWAATADRELVETFTDDLATHLLTRFELPWVELAVDKPGAVPDCDAIRIRLRREARD